MTVFVEIYKLKRVLGLGIVQKCLGVDVVCSCNMDQLID